MTFHLMARRARALSLGLVAALLVVACGGGGTVPSTGVSVRPLSSEFTARKAVAYSPYRTAVSDAERANETITPAMVKQDLELLIAGGFKLIRLFDSSDKVARLTLEVIRDHALDMKVMLGIYVQNGDAAYNAAEIARGIALANTHRNTVLAVSVGNETMVSWSFNKFTSAQIAAYLKTVRDAITQPVTTDDNWAYFANAAGEPNDPKAVLDTVDFVSMHTYPLLDTIPPAVASWDWEQQSAAAGMPRAIAMMDAAIASAKNEHDKVRAHLDSRGRTDLPIVIGETGWKASPSAGEFFRAHPVNQKMYFDRLNTWRDRARASGTGPRAIVYFEAFDEPWKGRDDKWGLFNVARQARCQVQDLYAQVPGVVPEPGSCAAADAVSAPSVVQSTIGQSRYVVYANASIADEARAGALQWIGFGGDSGNGGADTSFSGEVPAGTDADAPYREIAPAPASYGWGHFALSSSAAGSSEVVDLSLFEATGRLNFKLRSTYPGKLEVGFMTGSGATAYDVYLTLSNTNADGYGYVNDGQWHTVSIPIAAIRAAGAPAFGTSAPTSRFDLTKVTHPFSIGDRYGNTGNAGGAAVGSRVKVYVDEVYWSRN
ncbi:glycosyl hydrolase family 17 protein [Leptothrix discophora]|uniref:Endo-1,3-beta-glucanase btgC n=1 Tax=Leptothrix discophora TaxID=89 RepID=A0ABT9G320_LEPDI|nr:glycosyl hydrolase family 17 protein [Leptothrix discophora]MDP4300863.1 glycosyl hydrolase family 17 protein [Leptothrix discophora]